MVDTAKITSGYDVELIIGDEFFGSMLWILFESEATPGSWTETYGGQTLTVRLVPDFKVRLESAVTDNTVLAFSGFDVRVDVPIGSFVIPNLEIGLLFTFIVDAGETNTADCITLELRYWDLAAGWESKIPIDLEPYHAYVRRLLEDKFRVVTQTDLASGQIQDLAMRVFAKTESNMGAVGLYANLPFVAEPDGTRFASRGNVQNAQCLLPSREHSVAMAINPSVYEMMGISMKNDYAESQSGGNYTFPIYKDRIYRSGHLGNLKGVTVYPRSYPIASHPLLPVAKSPDLNGLHVFFAARVWYLSIEGDLSLHILIEPKIEEGQLSITVEVKSVHLDVDLEDRLIALLLFSWLIAFIGGVIGGWLSFGIAGGIALGMGLIAEELGIDYVEDALIAPEVERGIKPAASPLKAIPTRVTITTRRWDPFYVTHYQLLNRFDACDVLPEGIVASAFVHEYDTVNEPLRDIQIVGVTRNAEGSIEDVVYRVPNSAEIINPQLYRQPEGGPPERFLLSLDEIQQRIEGGRLRSTGYVTPTHVCHRKGRIAYIKFDTGLVLSPDEAGRLQVSNVLGVIGGYELIHMKRRDRFYYRTKRDATPRNNLAALPTFSPPDN